MKNVIFLILLSLVLAGCSHFRQSEFAEHDTMYKNWEHMKFSWNGYQNPTREDVEKSREQGWWGFDVPYVPGQ